MKYAHEQHPAEPIGVIAVSLGEAAALMASPLDIDALVFKCLFSNIANAVSNRTATRLGNPAELLLVQLQPRLGISRDTLRPLDRIGSVDCPAFLMSGAKDRHRTVELQTSM